MESHRLRENVEGICENREGLLLANSWFRTKQSQNSKK